MKPRKIVVKALLLPLDYEAATLAAERAVEYLTNLGFQVRLEIDVEPSNAEPSKAVK